MIVTNTVRNGVKRWHARGDNLMDVANYIATAPNKWGTRTSRDPATEWHGRASWEDNLRMMRQGWPEGVAMIQGVLDGIVIPNDHIRKTKHDIAGFVPDIPRYLGGAPDNMVNKGPRQSKKPVIKMAVDVRIMGGIRAKEQMNFGAAMVALIDKIEQTGKRVALDAYICMDDVFREKATFRWILSWGVKQAQDAVDLSALMYSMAHPCAFRRTGFAMMEKCGAKQSGVYGYGGGFKDGDVLEPEPDTLFINGVDYSAGACATLDTALQFVAKKINTAAKETLVTYEDIAA